MVNNLNEFLFWLLINTEEGIRGRGAINDDMVEFPRAGVVQGQDSICWVQEGERRKCWFGNEADGTFFIFEYQKSSVLTVGRSSSGAIEKNVVEFSL